MLLALIIILVGCATGVLGKITYNAHKENEYVTASNLKSDPRVKNVLLLGVDARPKDKASASRSDTMMLISVDSVHHTIKMTSFFARHLGVYPLQGYESTAERRLPVRRLQRRGRHH